jgi:adenylate cyclase
VPEPEHSPYPQRPRRPAEPARREPDIESLGAVELEQLILGDLRRYTPDEASVLGGVSRADSERLWRALGFADFGDARTFTDMDVDALRRMRELVRAGVLDDARVIQVVRSFGQTLSRLADWQVESLLERLIGPETAGEGRSAKAYAVTERLMPELERLLVYAWRRQLAATATRVLQGAADPDLTTGRLAVGFADLVGFTRLSRRLEEAELAHLVETFEARSADLVASLGGRLIKALGDEVLYVADSPVVAAEIGLSLVETLSTDDDIPELRVGMAIGNVLSRMGDVFGTTVNLASRLTSLAPRSSVVVDRELATVLAEHERYEVYAMWRRPVRGLGLVEPSLLIRRQR